MRAMPTWASAAVYITLLTEDLHDTIDKHVIVFLYTLTCFHKPIAHRSLDSSTLRRTLVVLLVLLLRWILMAARICDAPVLPSSGVHNSYTKQRVIFSLLVLFLLGKVPLFPALFTPRIPVCSLLRVLLFLCFPFLSSSPFHLYF